LQQISGSSSISISCSRSEAEAEAAAAAAAASADQQQSQHQLQQINSRSTAAVWCSSLPDRKNRKYREVYALQRS